MTDECEKNTQVKISGMSCMHCVNSVKTAIENVQGVKEASVDLETGLADVRHTCDDSVDFRLKEAVSRVGFGVVE